MTPLNNISKKLAVFVVLLSLFTALVASGCDSGSSGSATATPIATTDTGGAANPTAPIDTSNLPTPEPTAPGSAAPEGVGTSQPSLDTTPPAEVTGTPSSNSN